jgi:hypothetical protein
MRTPLTTHVQPFLNHLKVQGLPNLNLDLRWDLMFFNWQDRTNNMFDYISNDFVGLFKKVKITMVYYNKTEDGLAKMTILTESCAHRLLGSGAEEHCLLWGEEKDCGEKFYAQSKGVCRDDDDDEWEKMLVGLRRV